MTNTHRPHTLGMDDNENFGYVYCETKISQLLFPFHFYCKLKMEILDILSDDDHNVG